MCDHVSTGRVPRAAGPRMRAVGDQYLPWTTEPSDLGYNRCGWCDRVIYLPALPCSVEPIDGLMSVATLPGQGERCKWEVATRTPSLAGDERPLD